MEKRKKGHVGVVVYPERGGYYPTYQISKELERRGYNVTYLGAIEFEKETREQGFNYVIVTELGFENGVFDPFPHSDNLSYIQKLKIETERKLLKSEALYSSLVNCVYIDIFKRENIDLLLVDAMLVQLIVACCVDKIPVVSLCTELVGIDRSKPPFTHPLIHDPAKLLAPIRLKFSWFRYYLSIYVGSLYLNLIFSLFGFRRFPLELMKKYKELEQNCDTPFIDCEYMKRPQTDEIVLCPSVLDFYSGRNETKRVYVGHCIDVNRTEIEFDWGLVPDEFPIIYCSLGTHVADYNYSDKFFRVVLTVAKNNPEYTFLLSMGPGRNIDNYGEVPKNVISALSVPQLSVLKRAAMMITNGGLGTIKECTYFAVPMLVLPCDHDQPGNAARVSYHKIGRMDDIKHITEKKLIRHIKSLVHNSVYKVAIEEISKLVRLNTEFSEAVKLIENKMLDTNQTKEISSVRNR